MKELEEFWKTDWMFRSLEESNKYREILDFYK